MATTRASTRTTRATTRRRNTTRRTAKRAPLLSPELRVEIYGLVIVAFAVLVLLALISFEPGGGMRAGTANWVGPVGSRLGGLILSALGVFAFPIDLALLGYGVSVVLGTPLRPPRRVVWGSAGLAVALMVLVQLIADGGRVLGHHPAGMLGAYLTEGCRTLLSTAGTAVVAGTGFAIAVIWLTGASAAAALRPALRPVVQAFEFVRDTALDWWDDLREGRSAAPARAAEAPAEAEPEQEDAGPIIGSQPALPAARPGTKRTTRRRLAEPAPPRELRSPTRALEDEPELDYDAIVAEPAWVEPERAATRVGGPSRPRSAVVLTPEEAERLPDDGIEIEDATDEDFEAIAAGEPPAARAVTRVNEEPEAAEAPAPAARPARGREPGGPKIVESEAMRSAAQLPLGLPEPRKTVLTPSRQEWELPSLDYLDYEPPNREVISPELLKENASVLEQKLLDFGVKGKVVEIHPGPVITMYEFKPAPGVKISKIANLADDLSMALAAMRVRIVAPIPGKSVVGIEVPNKAREVVYLKEIFANDAFQKSKGMLSLALGKDIVGYPTCTDLAKAPHLLVAGSTGSGKSVALNSFIVSILYKATPDDVRLIMVDPKMLELSVYEGIPHLLLPVVTDPKKAAQALKWAVSEMERRYRLLADMGVRNIAGYNAQADEMRAAAEARRPAGMPGSIVLDEDGEIAGPPPEPEPLPERLPLIVVIIDELADLMMVASKEVETSIARLAQMARAAGIHLILATQRPSVDVITGLIKANFPTRVSFQVSSKIDSRTILDRQGAENLLGMGDMLFMPPGTSKLQRIHGAYIGEKEIARVTAVLKKQGKPDYCMEILADEEDGDGKSPKEEREYDEFYDQALAIVAETRNASISYLQRRLKIGYNRAARIVETMEHEGVVGPQNGPGPREVFVDPI